MAIVTNLARPEEGTDRALCTYNRTNAGEPNSSVTPLFVDEMILDTTGNVLWKALSMSNTSWVALTAVQPA